MPRVGAATRAAAIKAATPQAFLNYGYKAREIRSLADAENIGRLARAGYTDPDDLNVFTSKGYQPEANALERSSFDAYKTYADWVEADLTPERVGELSRAGIPPSKMTSIAPDADLEAESKPYRDEYKRLFKADYPSSS